MKLNSRQSYLFFLMFFYFFMLKDWIERIIGFVGYADEIIALLAIPIFILQLLKKRERIKKHSNKWTFSILISVVCGLLGNIIYRYQPFLQAALPDVLICVKFWLCIYVGQNSLARLDLNRYGKNIYNHVKALTIVYSMLIFADQFFHIFPADIRYGLRSTQLFYGYAFVFAACCVILLTLLFVIRESISHRQFCIFSIWLSILMCTTLRSRALGCAMMYWLIFYFVYIRKKKISIKSLLLFLPVVVLLGWNQIEYYFFSDIQDNSARFQLLIKSIQIANERFPIGAGFGTFGSYYSAVVYSPLYYLYGLSTVHGLIEGNAMFVSDSYWPMVLGQFGWIGLFATIIAVYLLFREIQKHRKRIPSYYSACLFILAYLLIESTSSSAFVHPLSIPMALLLGHFIRRMRDNERVVGISFKYMYR